MPTEPSLSVVLPTTEGWDHVVHCIEHLVPQLERVGGELIVVDSVPPSTPIEMSTSVRHVVVPDGSVFDLRARGIIESAGLIVAVTEDHCELPDDWCESILAAHERHPEAEAIGGAVDNGSRRTIGDWTNYFITFGAFAPPITTDSGRGLTIANSSYKRATLAHAEPRAGWLEFTLHAELLHPGRTVHANDVVVHHTQPRSVWECVAAHFHNGRTTTGLARSEWNRRQRRGRLVHGMRLPWSLTRDTLATVWPKRTYRARVVACATFIALVSTAHAVGEIWGLLRGAGSSPEQLA